MSKRVTGRGLCSEPNTRLYTGWRSADVGEESEADGYADDDEADGPPARGARAYASGVPAWESDAEDEETPRPSPVEGDASPSRRWIRGFA